MLKTLKKSKTEPRDRRAKDIDEHLLYILKNTTPYQRLVWLKKAFEFWKSLKRKRRASD